MSTIVNRRYVYETKKRFSFSLRAIGFFSRYNTKKFVALQGDKKQQP